MFEPNFPSTPLGKIALEIFIDQTSISNVPMVSEISKNSTQYFWDLEHFHLEILKVECIPKLPLGMHVDKCIAFLCKFKNKAKKMSLKFRCCLFLNEENLTGEPESGEGLIAQSWEDDNFRLSIGTEDEEYLLSRAKYSNGLPSRFAAENLLVPELIKYLEDGIEVELPSFQLNEEGQVQFVISWVKKNQYSLSTWFAVDLSPDEILAAAF